MQQKMNLDPRTLPSEYCEKCNGMTFKVVYIMKRVSPILSGQARVQFFPVELFACETCGHVNKEFDSLGILTNTTVEPEIPKSSLTL